MAKVGATAAAIGGAYFGARRGLFGTRVGMATNLFHGNMGAMIGSQSMVNSAATKFSKQLDKNINKNTGIYDNIKGAFGKDVAKNTSKKSTEAIKNQMTNFWNSGKKVDNIMNTVSSTDTIAKRVGNYGNFNRKGTEIKDNVTQFNRKVDHADRFNRITGNNFVSNYFKGGSSY
jgi:hypothetical protein